MEAGLAPEEQRRVAVERGFPLEMRGRWEAVEDRILLLAEERQGKPALEGDGLFAAFRDGNLEIIGPCSSLVFRPASGLKANED